MICFLRQLLAMLITMAAGGIIAHLQTDGSHKKLSERMHHVATVLSVTLAANHALVGLNHWQRLLAFACFMFGGWLILWSYLLFWLFATEDSPQDYQLHQALRYRLGM